MAQRIAVVGGTGLAGRQVVAALHRQGHEAVVVARSAGVDAVDPSSLAAALEGVSAVIDTISTLEVDADKAVQFFDAVTSNVATTAAAAGVGHHVVLSILNVDQVQGNAHYAGKRRQEELVQGGALPWTVVRAAQFHDFAAMVVGWTRHDGEAQIPPLLVQPIDVTEVAEALVKAALSPAAGIVEVAGPEPQDLVDMARRTLAARGDTVRLIPTWHGPLGPEMAGDVLLPGPETTLATITFEQWLATQSPATVSV